MTLLTAKKELVAVHELISGTSPTGSMTSAGNADVLINSAEPTFDVDFFDRDFLRTTLTKLKSVPGQKTGGVTITTEMLGNSDDTFASGVPPWSKFMEMSGFRLVLLDKVLLNATQSNWDEDTDGPLRHGELIEDAAGGDTGRIVGDVHRDTSGTQFIYYEVINGTLTGSADWTTSDTEITVAVTTISTSVGWAWIPISEPWKQIDIDDPAATVTIGTVYQGDDSGSTLVVSKGVVSGDTVLVYRGGAGVFTNNEQLTKVSGAGSDPTNLQVDPTANEQFYQWPTGSVRLNEDGVAVDFVASRSNVSFGFEVNRPVIMTFTTRGRWDSGDSTSDLSGVGDTPLLGGTPTVVDPKLWAGQATDMALNETLSEQDLDDEQTACLKSLTIDAGVTLTDNQCAHSEDGLLEIVGSSRSASGSLEANATLEAEIPWLTTFRSGEVTRLRVQVGGTTGNPENGFQFLLPAMQYTGAASGDSDGILTRNMDFSLNAGVMNNLGATAAGEISSISGDNEIILMYIVD